MRARSICSDRAVCILGRYIMTESCTCSVATYIPKHLRREVNKEELDGFHKRVKRVPKGMSFEYAYHKYRLGNLFRES